MPLSRALLPAASRPPACSLLQMTHAGPHPGMLYFSKITEVWEAPASRLGLSWSKVRDEGRPLPGRDFYTEMSRGSSRKGNRRGDRLSNSSLPDSSQVPRDLQIQSDTVAHYLSTRLPVLGRHHCPPAILPANPSMTSIVTKGHL